jgi:DNA-directed RNA polymerase beta' subunit
MALPGPDPAYWPVHFIITALPVLPPCARPWVMMFSGEKADADITYKVADIVSTHRYNDKLLNPRLSPAGLLIKKTCLIF